ncbi:MAG TPA: GNAT family N-acetyltransferase [Thermoanaerobaculia bacterium]|nr:GNAT family N-acetyltransferase [Thermoanaerobaculia bacterium]
MSEVRLATMGDRRHFQRLAAEFAEEGVTPGMVAGPATEAFFARLFVQYVYDLPETGAVAVHPAGFCMAGGPIPYDTPWGKTASGWGTYVRPEHRRSGLATALRDLVVLRLRELGFRAIIGATHIDNPAGPASVARFGWQPLGQSGVALLEE